MNYDDGQDDDGNGGYGYDNLPMCEQTGNGYVGLACADDGSFSLQYFSDAYCLQPTGSTYDRLRSLNRALRSYKSCSALSSGNSLAAKLVQSSDSCSSLDSGLCTDNSAMKNRRSHTSKASVFSGRRRSFASASFIMKVKYVASGLLLLASFIMFTGILFTNRRRRRALMQRKYRQSKRRKSKSSRSKSKGREHRSSRDKSSSRRSKSRTRNEDEDGGIFT